MGYDKRQRVAMAKTHLALPITNDSGEILDGLLPIATRDDLAEAIKNLPRAGNRSAVKAHVSRRAAALGALELLPTDWSKAPASKRRGRPVGSVSLTREREDRILGLIRGGVFPHIAAESAAVSARTLRGWIARGEDRSSRPSTPKLRAFAGKFRQAQADARALAEAKVYKEDVKWWLAHAAPSRDGLLGWTTLPEGSDAEADVPSPEELKELITGIRNDQLYSDPSVVVPECLNRRCRCAFHHPRTPEELERLRAIAAKRRKSRGGER